MDPAPNIYLHCMYLSIPRIQISTQMVTMQDMYWIYIELLVLCRIRGWFGICIQGKHEILVVAAVLPYIKEVW